MYKLCKEPDAGKPQVRICWGQVSQGACLPDIQANSWIIYTFLKTKRRISPNNRRQILNCMKAGRKGICIASV